MRSQGDKLTGNAMSRFDIFQMIKRRAKEAGTALLHLLPHIQSHWYHDVSA
jgi:hypothetical protein